jgi:hypothetical protein
VRVHILSRPWRPSSVANDRGAIAVIVGLLMTVLLLMAAFAADIANAYANARQLSVSADAASLSAAAKVGEAYSSAFPNTACDPANLTTMNADQVAQAEADRVNTANNKTGASEPVGPVSVTCANSNKSIEVSIANNREVKTGLAGIIGIDSIKPNSYAVARYQKSTVGGGLRPWAVCDSVVLDARNHPDTTYWTALGNWNAKSGDAGICGTSAPGNWGSVDFDGGGNPAGDLASWTLNGYPGSVTIPDPAIPADPGVSNSSGLVAAFQYLVGKVVLFPSVSSIAGTGSNATFVANGVATLKICGIYYANNTYNIDQSTGLQSDCWQDPQPSTTTTPMTSSIVASMADGSKVVTATAPGAFNPDMVGGTIDVPQAGSNDGTTPLIGGHITAVSPDGLTATVANSDKAKHVATGVTTTVHWSKVDVVPGTLNVPVDNSGKVIDHIQFRWVDYTTNYSGPGGTTCELSDPLCVGTTLLWD